MMLNFTNAIVKFITSNISFTILQFIVDVDLEGTSEAYARNVEIDGYIFQADED